MNTLYFVLFLVAVILFVVSAFGMLSDERVRRVNLMALGLAFFAAPFCLQALDKL